MNTATDVCCSRTTCTSKKDAVWCPVLLLLARPNTEPARARLHMRLCDDCRDAVKLSDFTADEQWSTVLKRWPARFAHPLRELTQLDWDLVELDEDITEP